MKYLVRKRALGDVLWIEPVIRNLAKTNKALVVYTKFPELFYNYPLSNVQFKKQVSFFGRLLIALEKEIRLSIVAINLDNAYEKKPDIHFLHAYQQAAGLSITNEYPKLHLSNEEKELRLVAGKYIVLHLESFSQKKFRQIFGVNWGEVIRFFNERGYKVVQIGLSASETIEGTISMKTSLRELMSLCYHASLFIGIDSGPSHIAASLKVPSLIFFGAVNPLNRHFPELFKGILMKQPCEYDNDQAIVLKESCLICHRSTDKDVALCSTYSTETVLSAIRQLMHDYDL